MNPLAIVILRILSVFWVIYPISLFAMPWGRCIKTDPLLDLANYVGEDKREPLSIGGPKLGLSDEEIARLRKVNGIVTCSMSKKMNGSCSASLVGDGKQIVTAAHCFADSDTKKFYEPLSKCTFTNFDNPPETSTLAIDSSHNGMVVGKDFFNQHHNDYAFAKLAKPITNVKPFPVDLSDTQIRNFKDTIVISALQANMQKPDPKQPIVEPCTMEEKTFIGVTTIYYNDCTVFPGASGGSQYVRSSSGELVLKGIVIEQGWAKRGDYDKDAGAYAMSIAIGTRALSDLLKFDTSIQVGNGGINDTP